MEHFSILKIVLMIVLFLGNCVEEGLPLTHIVANVGLAPHEPSAHRRRKGKVLRGQVLALSSII